VAIYVQKGLLSWNATVSSIFPEISNKFHPDFRNVTVAMLTAHHSGVTKGCKDFNNGSLWKALRVPSLKPTDGRKMVVTEVLSRPPSSTPGTRAEPSNFNYAIIGAILEKISGYPWETVINAELFSPLGMTSCGFGAPSVLPDEPWGHKPNKGKHKGGPITYAPEVPHDNPATIAPGGGVHCSLQDWAKFVRFHIDGFNGKSTPLLRPESFKILHESYQHDKHTCGGWVVKYEMGGTVLTHAGSNTMYYAVVFAAPAKDCAILVVTNAGGDEAKMTCDERVKALLDAMQ